MEADIQLVQDLRHPRPELVLRAGEIVWDHGSYLPIPLLTKFQTTCRAPFISVP